MSSIYVVSYCRLSGVSPFYADSDDEMWTNIKSVRYDVHLLYHNVSKHALKFLYQTLRRNPKYVVEVVSIRNSQVKFIQ